jgi:hypothetical protein
VLTTATLALVAYALYALGWGVLDLLWWSTLEVWADLTTMAIGALLVPAAVLVRARIPGGLPLAFAALVGLEAISLHNSMHRHGEIWVAAEALRGVFGLGLMALAWWGQKEEATREDREKAIGDRR